MMKKTLRAGAFGLTMALAVATLGGITPKGALAVSNEIAVADESETKETSAGWMLDDSWIAAEDTTVTDEVGKMIRDSFMHVVGVGHSPIMYLGYQTTESGTNHCILVKAFPVVPDPAYRYELYYVHEDPAGTYKVYNTRILAPSEYPEYSIIGQVAEISGFFKYDWQTDTYWYYSGKAVYRIALRQDGADEKPERNSTGEGIRILTAEEMANYYFEDLDYSANPDAATPSMIINGTEYAFEGGRISLDRVPAASRYDITMTGAEKPLLKVVSLSKKKVTLKKGKKKTINARVSYDMEDSVTLVWKSSNKKIATVKDGVIKAKKKGTCKITCRVKGSSAKALTCKVKVK